LYSYAYENVYDPGKTMDDKVKDEIGGMEQNELDRKIDDLYKKFAPKLTLRRVIFIIFILIAMGHILFYPLFHTRGGIAIQSGRIP
jgi:hypothetical protein